MKKIPSFTVNHLTLRRGVYVSRQDRVGDEIVTTFDVRMKAPNREPALHVNAIHTMEHLAATFLRNHPVWADRVIYWGPMGCLTGNYLILKGDLTSSEIVPLLIETHGAVGIAQISRRSVALHHPRSLALSGLNPFAGASRAIVRARIHAVFKKSLRFFTHLP